MKQEDQAGLVVDFSKILVAAKSPINRIVLAKIVEQAGLKPVAESPETAGLTLLGLIPGVVILDGGAEIRDCDELIPVIARTRSTLQRALPVVILLSNRNGTVESLGLSAVIDAVVAKPITPEKLQPVVERLIAQARA
jgi:CheY-like chemotaxis protein